jgi:hypothetical protein
MSNLVRVLEKFQGWEISFDAEEGGGYFWRHGGYFNSLPDCKEGIRDWNSEARERDPAYPPADTPCLEDYSQR